jgi:hypothetical protein
MHRCFGFLWIVLAAAPGFAEPISVTLSGNFGAPSGGSSIFDNQSYQVTFIIPDQSSPSGTTCCAAQIAATYDVNANLAVPGIGLSVNNVVQVTYVSQSPLGTWLNIFSFTGLPVGDSMVLTPLGVNSGDLWNGLVEPLGTPMITLLDNAFGSGIWHLEENSSVGPIPIAVYATGPVAVTAAAAVPEPASVWLLAGALAACGFVRGMRTAVKSGGGRFENPS